MENKKSEADEGPALGEDAIPKDAVWLTDAYEHVVKIICSDRSFHFEFDDEWREALEKSRQFEHTVGHDAEAFDEQLEQEWHQRKQANVILRLAIDSKKLIACVRDPGTGEVLQLSSQGWVNEGWDECIPASIWSDYLHPNDFECPGPSGSFIRGMLRPVFFMKAELEAWATTALSKGAYSSLEQCVLPKFGKRPRDAVREALLAIWGGPPPAGVPKKTQLEMVNNWLKQHRRSTVSRHTLDRALTRRP